jgi:hypothetical protein
MRTAIEGPSWGVEIKTAMQNPTPGGNVCTLGKRNSSETANLESSSKPIAIP